MSYERIMGIQVSDETEYQKYREAMEPLLISIGGSFGFDFKIAEVLRSKTDEPINRVFTLSFDSKQVMDDFFSSADYLTIREQHFDKSVSSKTVIALYSTDD
ncbi:DUF1330 domain-containing protein [Marinicellulosiphila megalodicopiae]|uniref:DUF1330 domain-containing protein n=1 Tax=Marinicellulosiphila megalodicopiae TaxID=2724896 RepID=UPI003BB1262C